jgi:hypothetical protein
MSERPPHTEVEIVELVRAIDVPAPAALHSRIDALIAEHERQPAVPRWRRGTPLRLGLAGALALAAIAVALVAGLSGGGSSLTLHKTVALTLRSATAPAPAPDPANHKELAANVEGIAFPNWNYGFGWSSTGSRSDRLDGHTVRTVFYARGRQWIGYAIVAGRAPSVSGGLVRQRQGTVFRLRSEAGVRVLTWLRDGRLCVVAGRGVSDATLMALASWHSHGMLAS